MKKRKFKLLSIAIIALLAIPQNTIAAVINNTESKGKTIYYLEKNGVRQTFTQDSQGTIIPDSTYSTQNTMSTNSNTISNLTTNNAQTNILKDQLVLQSLTKSSELIYDDASSFLKYTGKWTNDINAGNEGGTAKLLNSSGNVSFSFTGSSVKWTGFKDKKQGIGRVVIDGVTQAEVNLYAKSRGDKQLLFEKSLNFGKHVMEIQWAGTPDKHGKVKKNDPAINIDTIRINISAPKATAPIITSSIGHASNISLTFKNNDESAEQLYVYKSTAGSNFTLLSTYNSSDSKDQEFLLEDTDVLNNVIYNYYVTAVNTMGESVPSNTVTTSKLTTNSVYNLEDTNSNIDYTGTWNSEPTSTYSGGSSHVTVEAGSKVSIPFTAFESRIKLMSGPDMGIARIHWSNANGDYYDANLNTPSEDYCSFGTSSNMQTSSNWVIECLSGKIVFDVEEIWDYTTTAPISPTNLNGILANNTVSLNWNANTELDLKGYNIYRSTTAGSDYTLLNPAPITNAQFTDNLIVANKDYHYVVKTVNYANLESTASNELRITHAIAAPTGLTGTLSGTSAVLNWTQHIDPIATQYNIYRTTTSGSNYQLLDTILIPISTYTDSTVVAGTTYYYAITAVSSTGVASDRSNEVTVIVPEIVTAPTGLIGTLSGTSAVLNWTKHSDPAVTQYNIYRTTTSGSNYQLLNTTLNPILTYTDSTVVAGTTYYYAISAVSSTGVASDRSNEVIVIVPEIVTAPTGLIGTLSGTSAVLNWIKHSDPAVTQYNIYRSTTSGSNYQLLNTTLNPLLTYTDSTVVAGTTYYYAITAVSSTGVASDRSNEVTVIVPEIVTAPTGLIGTLSGTSAVLNWTKHSDPAVTQYNIYRSTTSDSNYQLLNTTLNPLLIYTDSTVVAGTTYYYAISVVSGTGVESVKSNEVMVVVPATVPPSGGNTQRFEETNSNIVYTGTWTSGVASAFSNGTAKLSQVINSYLEFTFTGTGIRWISYLSSNRGQAIVYIDGNLISKVDTYSASAKAQKVAFEKLDLSSGSHTIKIVVAETRNSASIGNFITVDAFDVILLPSNEEIVIIPEVSASAPTGIIGTLSGSSVLLNWTKHTDPAVTEYRIYRTTTSGSNYQLLNTVSNPILTYTDSMVVTGTTYYYAITAVSSAGLESVKSNEVKIIVPATVPTIGGNTQRFEETNSNIVYTGTWTPVPHPSFSDGTAKLSNVINSYLEFTFTGTGIRWISYLSSNRGQANVYIDGNLTSTVDTYSASAKAENVAFEKLDLSSGSHTIKIVIADTRNSASKGNFITVDAFDVILLPSNEEVVIIPVVPANAPTGITGTLSGSSVLLNWTKHTDPAVTEYRIYRTTTPGSNYQLLTTVSNPILTYTDLTVIAGTTYYYVITAVSSSGTDSIKSNEVTVRVPAKVVASGGTTQRFEETNSDIVYTGTWTPVRHPSFSDGTAKLSNVVNSYLEFTFTGTGIRWISYLSSNRGQANVYIDGNLITKVDTYSALPQSQKVAFEKLDLSFASHTIKIVVAETRNSASIGNLIAVDAFDVILLPSNEEIVIIPVVPAIAPTGITGITGTLSRSSVLLNWTKHTDPAVTEYKIYRTTTSGSNYQLLNTVSNANLTCTDSTVVTGTTYYYAITAVSSAGLESVKSNEVKIIVPAAVPTIGGNTQRFEETNSDIVYTGTWTPVPHPSFSDGTAKLSNVINSYLEFTFTGTGIRWISYLSSNRGQANVYIDGNLITKVDTYSASAKALKVAFEKLDLSPGSHKIKIVIAETRNAASIGNFITVDAFDVISLPSNEEIVIIPVVPANAPTSLTGTLTGSSALLNWTMHTDPTVTEYKIYRSTTSVSNYQLLSTVSNPILTYTDSMVVTGTTYYYAITAVSSAGLESVKSNEVKIIVPAAVPTIGGNTQRFEETNSNIVYTGTWTPVPHPSFSDGTAKLSNVINSYLEFTFTGTGIRWISYLSSNRGQANVYIDGNLITKVDTYSTSAKALKVAFEKLDLSPGYHTIKIVIAETRNAASIGNFITVDAFDVLN